MVDLSFSCGDSQGRKFTLFRTVLFKFSEHLVILVFVLIDVVTCVGVSQTSQVCFLQNICP